LESQGEWPIMQPLWPEIYAIIHQRLQYSVKEIGGGKKIRGLAIRPVFGKFGKTQQNSLKFSRNSFWTRKE
jgi:hypothetical protein